MKSATKPQWFVRVAPLARLTAWRWAQANRHPDGALPSGKAIAEQFERSAQDVEFHHGRDELLGYHSRDRNGSDDVTGDRLGFVPQFGVCGQQPVQHEDGFAAGRRSQEIQSEGWNVTSPSVNRPTGVSSRTRRFLWAKPSTVPVMPCMQAGLMRGSKVTHSVARSSIPSFSQLRSATT
jgi:hypothetical protein